MNIVDKYWKKYEGNSLHYMLEDNFFVEDANFLLSCNDKGLSKQAPKTKERV